MDTEPTTLSDEEIETITGDPAATMPADTDDSDQTDADADDSDADADADDPS